MTDVGEELPLWDGVAPGSEDWTIEERQEETPHTTVVRNVVRPTLTPVLPDPAAATGTGVLVCPGGGYFMLAIGHEGFAVAEWLAARGIAAFVLKYRVLQTPYDDPNSPYPPTDVGRKMDEFAPIPRADGQAALRLIGAHADDWGVRMDRVGAVGFSAGGRLVMDLAVQEDPSARPAFVGDIYGAPANSPVPKDAPPLFLAVATDDFLLESSVQTYLEWQRLERPVEAHFYGRGGHGFGMSKKGLPSDTWIERFHDWIASEGLLG